MSNRKVGSDELGAFGDVLDLLPDHQRDRVVGVEKANRSAAKKEERSNIDFLERERARLIKLEEFYARSAKIASEYPQGHKIIQELKEETLQKKYELSEKLMQEDSSLNAHLAHLFNKTF